MNMKKMIWVILYVTKGISDYYPLVLAHTDSVHDIEEMVVKEEYLPNSQGESKLALKAYTKEDGFTYRYRW